MRSALLLIIGIGLLSAQTVCAMETNEPEATSTYNEDSTPDPAPSVDASAEDVTEDANEIMLLTRTRAGLYGSAYWLVANVDSWFGDLPFDEGGRVWGSLRVRGLYREDDGYSTDFRYRLRVRMPNVSQRAYVFIGRDNEQDLVTDQSEAFRREQQLTPESRDDEQTFFAGIGFYLRENVDLRLGVRGGYKAYGQARYRHVWWFSEEANLEYRQTLFLAVDDGLGTTTALNYARALNPRTAFRWRNSATVSTETNGAAWSTSVGLFQNFGKERELSYELLGRGQTGADVPVRQYGVRAIWSQPVHRDWVIGEVIVGHFWPRGENDPERYGTWAVGLGLELLY